MIKVIASGVYSSLQDLGRFGFRNCGVPVSGGMDLKSLALANALVGNHPNDAVLEITATGPILKFEEAAVVAMSGADFTPMVDGDSMGMNIVFAVSEGSTLSFGMPSRGIRGYLAIKGGFKTEEVLGSTSFYRGITSLWQLHKGDILQFHAEATGFTERERYRKTDDSGFETNTLKVFRGPEFEMLSPGLQNSLFETTFFINSQSNRMAYLLDHSEELSARPIISAPVQPGTVQLTPGGKTIVLMRDAQTTGGYARIFQLTEAAINQLAQKRAGEAIQFTLWQG